MEQPAEKSCTALTCLRRVNNDNNYYYYCKNNKLLLLQQALELYRDLFDFTGEERAFRACAKLLFTRHGIKDNMSNLREKYYKFMAPSRT